MEILKVNDTKKAACNECQSFEDVTFKLRDAPLSDGSSVVKNVLVGVCNKCDSIAILPHQSTPAVQKQLEIQRKAIESRVPAHLIDILNLVSYELGGGVDFMPNLMKFYIHSLSNASISPHNMSKYLDSDLAQGKAQKRISIKGRHVMEELNALKLITNINSTTDIIRSVVLKINDDLLVNKKQKTIKQLKNIIAATT